ncbi:MAG: cadmium-translocating P-type ATPase [Ruminococcaceae bacterium]|nr:cadmium-translocating P-type ATPase [Oscillospiraceae bacterium]
MSRKQKIDLARILIAGALTAALHFLPVTGALRFALYMLPYGIVGYDVLCKAFRGIKNRQPLDESLLMTVATVGALALALYEKSGDYVEAIAVMLFYQVGEWFQSCAVGKSRRSIAALMDIAPDHANIETENGQLEQVDPDDVEVGTVIVIQPGERVPIDGVVVGGTSALDTAALTGESVPRDVSEGDEIVSGCINLSGVLHVRTTKEFGESTVSRVLELIEDASSRKSRSENFITKFARVYTPAVVGSALALAFLPPVILLLAGREPGWGTWIYRALTFLVISCPCALVVSIPLSFFAGIGGASRQGVLVKGSSYLETLSEAKTVVFDKTGTLTKGVFEVTAIHPDNMDSEHLLHLAAHVERYSVHPIASSLRAAYPNEADDCTVENVEELAGHGVIARVNGDSVAVGNGRLMEKVGAQWRECHRTGTILHVAINGDYAGHIVISDVVKPHSAQAIAALKKSGVEQTIMLTGDTKAVAESVAAELGLDRVYSGLLPQDKVSQVEKLLEEKSAERARLVFVGDGINDAPVLSRADIGVAMGAMGSDAAIEAADIVLMDDDPLKIATAVRISRKCLRIVKENIWFAIGVKLACLVLGAFGVANMWFAIFADVGVMILAVLNAIRCMFVK